MNDWKTQQLMLPKKLTLEIKILKKKRKDWNNIAQKGIYNLKDAKIFMKFSNRLAIRLFYYT